MIVFLSHFQLSTFTFFLLSFFFHFFQAAKDTKHRVGPAADQMTIIHFNDVYNVDSREETEAEKEQAAKAVEEGKEPELQPVGGAARFATAVKAYDELSPMVLFSGDIFAPSMRKSLSFSPLSFTK